MSLRGVRGRHLRLSRFVPGLSGRLRGLRGLLRGGSRQEHFQQDAGFHGVEQVPAQQAGGDFRVVGCRDFRVAPFQRGAQILGQGFQVPDEEDLGVGGGVFVAGGGEVGGQPGGGIAQGGRDGGGERFQVLGEDGVEQDIEIDEVSLDGSGRHPDAFGEFGHGHRVAAVSREEGGGAVQDEPLSRFLLRGERGSQTGDVAGGFADQAEGRFHARDHTELRENKSSVLIERYGLMFHIFSSWIRVPVRPPCGLGA